MWFGQPIYSRPQNNHRLQTGGPARREISDNECHRDHHHWHEDKGQGIAGTDVEEQAA
jgi:hypothetical protein